MIDTKTFLKTEPLILKIIYGIGIILFLVYIIISWAFDNRIEYLRHIGWLTIILYFARKFYRDRKENKNNISK